MGKVFTGLAVAAAASVGLYAWAYETHPEAVKQFQEVVSDLTTEPPAVSTTIEGTPVTTIAHAPEQQAGCTNLADVDPRLLVGQVVMALAHTDKKLTGVNELPQLEDALVNHKVGNFTLLDTYPQSIKFHGVTMSVADVITTLKAENTSGIDMHVGIDDEGGSVQRTKELPGFERIPTARELARSQSPEQVAQLFTVHGEKLRQLGVTIDLAPVADVGDGKQIGTRSFGTDPAVVKQYAGAVMDGLHAAGIKGTFKHFPGLGLVNEDTHNSAGSTPSFDQMQDGLSVFSDLIANKNPDFVLVSHASTDGLTELGQPASLSPAVYQLARTYGFGGVLMTDSLGMDAIKAYVGTDDPAESQKRAALQAIQAGADMVLVEAPVASAVAGDLYGKLQAGEIPRDRLFEAAARVLVTKGYNPCA